MIQNGTNKVNIDFNKKHTIMFYMHLLLTFHLSLLTLFY